VRIAIITIIFFCINIIISCTDETKNNNATSTDSTYIEKVTPKTNTARISSSVKPSDSIPRSPKEIAAKHKIIKKQSSVNPKLRDELQTLIDNITTAKRTTKRKLTKQLPPKFADLGTKCITGVFVDDAKKHYTPKEYARRLKLLNNITIVVEEVLSNQEKLITQVKVTEKVIKAM